MPSDLPSDLPSREIPRDEDLRRGEFIYRAIISGLLSYFIEKSL